MRIDVYEAKIAMISLVWNQEEACTDVHIMMRHFYLDDRLTSGCLIFRGVARFDFDLGTALVNDLTGIEMKSMGELISVEIESVPFKHTIVCKEIYVRPIDKDMVKLKINISGDEQIR